MHINLLKLLKCPKTQSPLRLCKKAILLDGYIKEGVLESENGEKYSIRNYIPRFSNEDYAESFSIQWEKHPEILMNNFSGYSVYETRFREETRWPVDLSGELILEAGCGLGAFTPFALRSGATIISLDLSRSVEVALENIGESERNGFFQASIYDIPFEDGIFDRIFCFGVLQHTPDPKMAFDSLISKLKPGGSIAIDSYVVPDPSLGGGHRLLRAKYKVRKIIPRIPARALHVCVSAYVFMFWPLMRMLYKWHPNGVELSRSMLIDDYAARMVGMDPKYFKEFAVLDIFDFLSPTYDIPQTEVSLRELFMAAGLEKIEVHPGYNGLEGRGRKPQ